MISSGRKTIEMRLFDERRKDLQVGDEIIFTNNVDGRKIRAKIKDLQVFSDFYALYKAYPKTMIGYLETEVADPADMYQYYDKQRIEKYGALAIEIELLSDVF